MTNHYSADGSAFTLLAKPADPAWRPPQRGALGALVAHWSLPHRGPALVSVPTGSGKSAIAAAAPYLVGANRVLVVVPSRDLREQISEAFSKESVLRAINARSGAAEPVVQQLTSRVENWEDLLRADVIVAIPNSISPAYYEENPPPPDLFDLLVVDEAHHAPAPTWQAILDHFVSARALLLTATPQRRDGRRVPGEMVYHYPLRQALDEGLYKPVRPLVIDLDDDVTQASRDLLIVGQVVELALQPEHQSSTVLIRASTIARAQQLAGLYRGAGLQTEAMSSRLSAGNRAKIVERLRAGELRAVAVVDMLGEGFDLPSLRIAAYHDKHKSLNATIQLIGRLVRADDRYPQEVGPCDRARHRRVPTTSRCSQVTLGGGRRLGGRPAGGHRRSGCRQHREPRIRGSVFPGATPTRG
jgi:superfamily II DNA or RNA helicase